MKKQMETRKNATGFMAAANILLGVGLLLMLFGTTSKGELQIAYLISSIVVYVLGSQLQLEAYKVGYTAPEK